MNVIDAKHIDKQRVWSLETFGPGDRTYGLISHITKELAEIENDPQDLYEWVDVIILALDGAWRSGFDSQRIIDAIIEKQDINYKRNWPDWRGYSNGEAIEHIK